MLANEHDQLWTRRVLWLLASVFAFRLIYLFTCIDFQIGGDEAYYFDWGRKLDWCYFSKPPLIGWLMAVVRVIFGYKWWAIRLAALVLGTCSLTMMFLLGRRVFDARTGFWAVVLLLCTPANVAANFAFTIDSPLVLCWTSALLLFWLVMEKPESMVRWIALTLVIGIGTLAKQMMLVFPLLMVIFAWGSKGHRGLLKRGAFWACIAGGLLFLTPMLWWNTKHAWVTLAHTSEHFHQDEQTLMERVLQFFRFPVLQAATYSPITFGVIVAAFVACWRGWKMIGDRERMLMVFSVPALLVFVLLAMRQYINENWPAVYYLSAFVLAAGLALQNEVMQRWMHRGWKLGAALVVFVYLMVPLIPVLGLTGHKKFDPAVSMRGWDAAAVQIGAMLDKVPHPERTFVMALDHRHNASQMAFHLPQHPTVYRWNRIHKVESQYEVWPDASDKVGWDCFLIYPDSEDNGYEKQRLNRLLRQAFEKNAKLGDVDVMLGNGAQRSFQVFLLKRMKHWPEHELPGTPPIQEEPQ